MCNLINTHTLTHIHTHRNKAHKSCRRHVGNGRDSGGKRKKCRKEKLFSVVANPYNLENSKEAGGGSTRYPELK